MNNSVSDSAKSEQTPVLLKILSGLHDGTAMELVPGDWLIGSDEESDLILTDAGMQPRHALLRVTEQGECGITPQNGSVQERGKNAEVAPVPPEGKALPAFTVLELGGVLLALGPAAGVWPDLRAPAPENNIADNTEGPAASEAAPKKNEAEAKSSAEPTHFLPRGAVPTASNSVGGNLVGGRPSNKVGGQRKWKPWRVAAGLFCLLLLLGLLLDFTKFGILFDPLEREAGSLASELQRQGFGKVSVNITEERGLLVQGLVESNQRLEALARQAEKYSPAPGLRVVSLEDLLAALKAQAKRQDAPLRIVKSGGSIGISGYVYDLDEFKELFKEEQAALDLLASKAALRVSLRTWDSAREEVARSLAAHNFAGRYALAPDLFHIALRVQALSAVELQEMQSVIQEVNDYFGVENVLLLEPWSQQQEQPKTPETAEQVPVESIPQVEQAAPRIVRVLKAPQRFTLPANAAPLTPLVRGCADLAFTGEGSDTAILFNGNVYQTGAILPGGLRLRVITPAFVALQEGAALTRICNATEMAKEQ
jgi:type III secretion system YscD/HrpQ family protein